MRRVIFMGLGAVALSLLAIVGLVSTQLVSPTSTPTLRVVVAAMTDTPTATSLSVASTTPTATETITPTETATPTPMMTIAASTGHAPRDWCTLNTVGIRKSLTGFEDLGAYEAYTWNRVITSTVAARYAAFGIPASSFPVTEPVTMSLTSVYGAGTFYVGYWKNEQPKIWKVTFLASGASAQDPVCRDSVWDTGITANVPPLGLVRVYIMRFCSNPIFVPVAQGTPTPTPLSGASATPSITPGGPTLTPTSTPTGGATPTPTATSTPGPSPTPTWTSTSPAVTTTPTSTPRPTNTPYNTATAAPTCCVYVPTSTVPPIQTPNPTSTPQPPATWTLAPTATGTKPPTPSQPTPTPLR